MAIDTFMVYVGVYADRQTAQSDDDLIKDRHPGAGLLDACAADDLEREARSVTDSQNG